MDSLFAQIDAWVVAVGLALTMLLAWGAGWCMGQRSRGHKGESSASKFDDASLALLARDHLPTVIVLLLFTSATMLVGREQGATGKTAVAGTVSFIILVTFAVYVTLDLNQPLRGLITVSQEPFQRLLASMAK